MMAKFMKPVLSKYTADNFRAINTLDPLVRPIFREFLWRIAMSGIYIRVISARRTSQQQDELYAIGRTKLGRVVTWVNDSNSFHVWGLAIDIVPLNRLGPLQFKAIWRKKHYYDTLQRIAREINIQNPWPSDRPHFHYCAGKSISQIKKGKFPKAPSFPSITLPSVLTRARNRLQSDTIIPISYPL